MHRGKPFVSGGELKRRMPLMRKNESCVQWHLAFCGGGCVLQTQAPPPVGGNKKFICLKSDLPRGCWITLRSDVYAQQGVKEDKYRWTVMSNIKNRQLSLALSNAAYPEWANSNNPQIKANVLTSVSGIGFNFDAQFGSDGKLRIVPDSGFVEIDNIEFVRK
jgi:hypothetical protein